jgi:putative membrane protein insertion efficiency factor
MGMSKLLIILVRMYQLVLSPLFGGSCRFYPSCSNYSIDAIRIHGSIKGLALSGWRLLRCNPFNNGGVDFVPGTEDQRAI